MKASTIFVSTLATLAAAAPTEKRSNVDLRLLNNLSGFNQLDFNYLLQINSLNLQGLGALGSVNNFNVLGFQNLFSQNQFDVQGLLQLQQLQTLLQFQSLGLFDGFDLQQLQLQQLQLGLINNVGGLDLSQFILSQNIPQIQSIASQVTVTVVNKE